MDKVQSVIIRFSDNTVGVFSGRALVYPGDKRKITNIRFTQPKELPREYTLEEVFLEDKSGE
jgi:hypothetical protein